MNTENTTISQFSHVSGEY